jgi:small subunit ribosomal protein S10
VQSAHSLRIPTTNPASLPTTTSLYTVTKGPFVHKKAQENFTRKTHRRVIKVFDADKGVIDLWLRYLRKNGIGGVGMKAQIWERVEFGYAKKEGDSITKQVSNKQDKPVSGKIEAAAEELVKELSS